jgi:hypothetical protein
MAFDRETRCIFHRVATLSSMQQSGKNKQILHPTKNNHHEAAPCLTQLLYPRRRGQCRNHQTPGHVVARYRRTGGLACAKPHEPARQAYDF